MTHDLILYSYYRSSASFRARIGLQLKELEFETKPVHLLEDGGRQHAEDYKDMNPMSQLPTLVHKGQVLSQSLPILMYLDDTFEGPHLFPKDTFSKAKVLQICEIINSGIQPLQNLSVLQVLERDYQFDSEMKKSWIQYWVKRGFTALERTLEQTSGAFCFGDEVTAADICLVPQVFSGQRFGVEPTEYSNISRINQACLSLSAFQKASPENQPDFPG